MKQSLRHFWAKCKPFSEDILLVLLIILVGTASFGLGRLSVEKVTKTPVRILGAGTGQGSESSVSSKSAGQVSASVSSAIDTSGKVVASKNGKVYHLPWCPGALKIKPENLIEFNNKEAAESAGLTPAANCKGL